MAKGKPSGEKKPFTIAMDYENLAEYRRNETETSEHGKRNALSFAATQQPLEPADV
jgi:hypothetical protein